MKKTFLTFLILMISFLANAQIMDIVYKVTNYSVNGENYDDYALLEDVTLVFYTCDNGELCFANSWRKSKSQSYGGVYALQTREYPETNEEYACTEFKFTWKFFNTYDSDRGEAAVTIQNIFIGSTVKFVAEIIVLKTNEVLQLQGYLEY